MELGQVKVCSLIMPIILRVIHGMILKLKVLLPSLSPFMSISGMKMKMIGGALGSRTANVAMKSSTMSARMGKLGSASARRNGRRFFQ